jgi:hypothetical protein
MLIPWDPNWSSNHSGWGGNGVQTDGIEASATADDLENFAYYENHDATEVFFQHKLYFDVTQTLQGWANGEANHGWLIKQVAPPDSGDTWYPASNENATSEWRPLLTVVLEPPLEIPTLSEWGMMFLFILIFGPAFWFVRRRESRLVNRG